MSSRFPRRMAPMVFLGAALLLGMAGTASAQRDEPVKFYPSNGEIGVWAGTAVQLNFDREVDVESVKQAFSLAPATAGTWRTDARWLSFEPDEPLLPGTRYTARLETTARDARGNPLVTAPLTSAFTTNQEAARPHFSGAIPLRFVPLAGERPLLFEPGYSRVTLDFTLYALDAAGMATRMAALPAWQWPQPDIPTAGLATVATWQQHVAQGDPTQRAELPDSVGAGLYVVDVRSPRVTPAQAFVVVTDHALVAKVGSDGLTVWDSTTPDGQPVAGAAVQALAADGSALGSATTDVDGLAILEGAGGAALVVSTRDGVPTVAGLGSAWQSAGWWWGGRGDATAAAGRSQRLAGHAHTDRPIYRPGHTVHWKATLRTVAREGYALPLPGQTLTATIRDAGNNLVWRGGATPDAFGSIDGNLALDVDAALGRWSLTVSDGTSEIYGGFQVEAYVKPDFEVTVTPERAWYVRGETARIEVAARYYFGQPAAGAQVVLRVYEGWWWRGSGQSPARELQGTLGPDGTLTFDVALIGNETSDQPMWFEAEVVDASRRPVVSEAQVTVHPAAFALTLESERYGVEAGEDVVLTAATRDHDGNAVAGVEVAIEVIQYRYPGGEVVQETRRVTTGADGTAVLRLSDLEPGWFSLRARASDAQGHTVQAYSYAWIFDMRYPWYWWGGLEVDLDHDVYAPGETARLLIKSPVTTTALVTIERDEVYDEFVVPVSGATPVEIPIRPEYAPNATVRVALWQPNKDANRTIKSSLLTAERTLVVPAEDKRLRVSVTPDSAAHGPRENASWTVRVTDDQGNPVRAQLSLAVVDKSVLALAGDTSGDIYEAFWTNWPGSVSTYDSHRAADGYSGFAEERSGGPGSGQPPVARPSPTQSAGAPDKGDDEASQATPRRDFPDTALWRATLETGADGTVVVPMTLPDSLTTWVALARAVAVDARAGQGSGEMVVSQPIIADLALPRFAVQGDRFAVDVLGRNYADPNAVLDGTVELASPGLVQLDPGTRALDLPFNETAFTRYSVVASTLGTQPVTAELDTPAGGDAIELPLDVAPFTVPDRVVRAGSTDAKAFETIEVPFNAVPGGTKLELRLSPGAALSVIDGIEELIGYPYGCVEQTMSRMLPNAVVGRLVAELGLDAPEITDELPGYMTIGLQKLYGFQNADGGWGWWSGDPQVYLTAYVMHGLVLSKAAGFDVDQAALDRGAAWLVTHFAEETDPRMQAYAAYVLAMDGRADEGRSTALFASAAKMDASALAALAMALDRAGEDALSGQVLDRLVAMADVGPTTAFWPMEVRDGWEPYHWRAMVTDEKNTALALDALTTLRPGDPLAPKAARWLLEHRYGAGWRTTQGTAFAILGLTDYLLTSGELDAEFDWTVRLGERNVASGSVNRDNITKRIPPVIIEGVNLPAGSHQLVIEKAGRGTLFYSAIADLARYYDGFAPASAAGYGVTLQREYVPVAGRSDANGWHVGDVLNVRMTLTTREDLWYVIAEDMLPAGLEGLNESLETESGRVPGGERPFWRWWGYERKEVRDDRVSFFASWLPAGTHTFEYAARAVTPGEFSARPATAYAMYRPEVWGRSASHQILVAADRVASRPNLPGDFDRDCRLTPFDASLVAEDWTSGRGRDLTGDGLVSVGDIAVAAGRGRQGPTCGDGVDLVAPTGATVAMGLREESAAAPDTFEIAITLDGASPVGAWEAALALPEGVTVTGIRAGNRLADAMLLPVVTDASGTVHVGGWSQADGTAGEALAILTLQRSDESGEVLLTGAEVTTADGRGYAVTHDGSVISPPERPLARIYLPTAAR